MQEGPDIVPLQVRTFDISSFVDFKGKLVVLSTHIIYKLYNCMMVQTASVGCCLFYHSFSNMRDNTKSTHKMCSCDISAPSLQVLHTTL